MNVGMTNPELPRSNRDHDIVLFGATGFVGKLTAEYLAAHAPAGLKIALAGRNQSKLEAVRDGLAASFPAAADFPLIVADSSDNAALERMAVSAHVVISTVGPYYRYGFPLVRSCAAAGTHYVDLCGEALFMRECIEENHEVARRTGARIVHACGFDSVPSEIGMLELHRVAAEAEETLTDATMLVKMKGGLSGGTVDSMREQFAAAKADRSKARALAQPYTLSPDESLEPDLGKQPDYGIVEASEFGAAEGWAGPFIMAGANTRVVRRSNALLGYAYGPRLRYREFISTGKGAKGRLRALALGAMMGAAMAAVNQPKLRPFLSRWVPEPGEGPSQEERDSGFFRTTHYGTSESGTRFISRVSLDADPGYKGTSLMLGEAALTLACNAADLPMQAFDANESSQGRSGGGVLTPATGLGEAYVNRLRAAGMEISAAQL